MEPEEDLFSTGGRKVSSNSKLASIFAQEPDYSALPQALSYKGAKQPPKGGSVPSMAQAAQPAAEKPLHLTMVTLLRYDAARVGSVVGQRACGLMRHPNGGVVLLCYDAADPSKRDLILQVQEGFTFMPQAPTYGFFYDDQRNYWCVQMATPEALNDLARAIGLAKGSASAASGGVSVVTQELVINSAEPRAISNGDAVKLRFNLHVFTPNARDLGPVLSVVGSEEKPKQTKLGSGKDILGLEQGLVGMKKGGRRMIIIPSNLAYGAAGNAPMNVPANASLVLEVELLKVKFAEPQAQAQLMPGGSSTPQIASPVRPPVIMLGGPSEAEEPAADDGEKPRRNSLMNRMAAMGGFAMPTMAHTGSGAPTQHSVQQHAPVATAVISAGETSDDLATPQAQAAAVQQQQQLSSPPAQPTLSHANSLQGGNYQPGQQQQPLQQQGITHDAHLQQQQQQQQQQLLLQQQQALLQQQQQQQQFGHPQQQPLHHSTQPQSQQPLQPQQQTYNPYAQPASHLASPYNNPHVVTQQQQPGQHHPNAASNSHLMQQQQQQQQQQPGFMSPYAPIGGAPGVHHQAYGAGLGVTSPPSGSLFTLESKLDTIQGQLARCLGTGNAYDPNPTLNGGQMLKGLTALIAERDELKTKAEKATEQVSELQTKITSLHERNETYLGENAKISESRFQSFTDELKLKNSTITDLQDSSRTMSHALNEAKAALQEAELRAQKLALELELARGEVSEKKSLEKSVALLQVQLDESRRTGHEAGETVKASMAGDLLRAQHDLLAAEKERGEQATKHATDLADAAAQAERSAVKIKAAETAHEQLEKKCDQLANDLSEAKSTLSQRDGEVAQLKLKLEHVALEGEGSKAELSSSITKLNEAAEARVAALQTDLEQARAQHREQVAAVEARETELRHSHEQALVEADEAALERGRQESAGLFKPKLDEVMQKATLKINHLQEELDATLAVKTDLEASVESLTEEKQNIIDASKAHIAKIRVQVQEQQQRHEEALEQAVAAANEATAAVAAAVAAAAPAPAESADGVDWRLKVKQTSQSLFQTLAASLAAEEEESFTRLQIRDLLMKDIKQVTLRMLQDEAAEEAEVVPQETAESSPAPEEEEGEVHQEPTTAASAAVTEEAVVDEPVGEQPEPVVEEEAIVEPVAEVEEAVVEAPIEEPVVEEPHVVEEPTPIEEPKPEEPAAVAAVEEVAASSSAAAKNKKKTKKKKNKKGKQAAAAKADEEDEEDDEPTVPAAAAVVEEPVVAAAPEPEPEVVAEPEPEPIVEAVPEPEAAAVIEPEQESEPELIEAEPESDLIAEPEQPEPRDDSDSVASSVPGGAPLGEPFDDESIPSRSRGGAISTPATASSAPAAAAVTSKPPAMVDPFDDGEFESAKPVAAAAPVPAPAAAAPAKKPKSLFGDSEDENEEDLFAAPKPVAKKEPVKKSLFDDDDF